MRVTYTKEQIDTLSKVIRDKNGELLRPNFIKLALERVLSESILDGYDLHRSVSGIATNNTPGHEYKSLVLGLLEEGLEEMPKYLAEDDPDLRVLSEWRLTIGK